MSIRLCAAILFSVSSLPAIALDRMDGLFATDAALCSDPSALIEGGVLFSWQDGFIADESDCEILTVTDSARTERAVIHALCTYAGMSTSEFFVVSHSSDGLVITGPSSGADEAPGMVAGETSFTRCDQ